MNLRMTWVFTNISTFITLISVCYTTSDWALISQVSWKSSLNTGSSCLVITIGIGNLIVK